MSAKSFPYRLIVLATLILFTPLVQQASTYALVGTWVKAIPADMVGGNTVRVSDGASSGWYTGPDWNPNWNPPTEKWYLWAGNGGIDIYGGGGWNDADHYCFYNGGFGPDYVKTTITGLDPAGAYNIRIVYGVTSTPGTGGVWAGLDSNSTFWTFYNSGNGTDTGIWVPGRTNGNPAPSQYALMHDPGSPVPAIGGEISVYIGDGIPTFYDGLTFEYVGPATPPTSPDPAYDPGPIDTGNNTSVYPTLRWMPGDGSITHDVYLGTSYNDVNTATTLSPEYKGDFSLEINHYETGLLDDGATYYWRVDEVNGVGTTKGTVWSFTTNGLLLWLKLDEGQSDVAYDSSGRGNDSTLEGSPKPNWISGYIDGALDLSGDLDYLEVTSDARDSTNASDFDDVYSRTPAMTIALWVKVNSTPASPSTNWWIASKGYIFGGWVLNGWSNYLGFKCVGLTPNDSAVSGGITLTDGNWHHIAGTYDGTTISLYVDGVLKDSKSASGTLRWTHHKVWIGDNSAVQDYGIDGAVDDVRIYGYGLGSTHIVDLYNNSYNANLAWQPGPISNTEKVSVNTTLSWLAGAGALSHDVYFGTNYDQVNDGGSFILAGDINTSGTVDGDDLQIIVSDWLSAGGLALSDITAYWTLDGNLNDTIGSHHGTNQSGQYVTAQYDQGLNFNPLFQQHAEVPDDDLLDITGDITISAWIYPERGTAFQSIIAKTLGSGATDTPFEVSTTNDTLPRLTLTRADASGKETVTSTQDLALNNWHHIVVRVNSNVADFYVNGIPTGKTGSLTKTPTANARPLYIGKRDDGLYFDGTIDEVSIFSRALSDTEIVRIYQHSTSDLDDDGIVSYPDFSIVALDWQQSSGSSYQGNYPNPSFIPGQLQPGTTYFWRIDEVTTSQTHKGPVWQFTTIPQTAWNPSPADSGAVRDLQTDLNWSAGADADSHDIYIGTDYNAVNNATIASVEFKINQTATTYDPGLLTLNTPYYWRIDERNGAETYKGSVWRFDTTDKWLFYFNGRLNNEERICAYALQGLVNRDGPRIFYVVKNNWAYQDTDLRWLEYLMDVKGYKFAPVNTLRELIQLARDEGYVNGLVQYTYYDSIGGQESVIAENYAASDSLLPVTTDILSYNSPALQLGSGDCFAGLTITDIRGNWATELAAQTWSINNQLPNCVTHGAFSHFYTEVAGDIESEVDHAVMGNYFVYDYDTQNNDEWNLYQQMSGYLDQPTALFGGVYSEIGAAGSRGCSSQGNYIIGGGGTLQNLSFLAQIPVAPANIVLGKPDNNMTLDPSKYYVTFLMNECDTPKIGMTFMSGCYFDDRRGTAPINWGFGLGLIDYFPIMMEYYQYYAGPNDHFFSGALGAGSFWPAFCPDNLLITYAQYVETLLQRTGIIMGENYGGSNIAKFELFSTHCPSMRLINAERYNNGTNEYLSNGTALTSCYGATEKPDQAGSLWYAWHLPPNINQDFDKAELVRRIKAFATTKTPPYFITVYGRPVEFAPWAADGLADDPRFVIVGVEDFVHLMEQAAP